jgi:putative ABC transport system substrate-binding protein
MFHASDEAARSMALAVRAVPVTNDSEIETVMAGIAHEDRSGLVVLASAFTVAHYAAIVAIANRDHIPAVYGIAVFAANGGLMSYGPDVSDLFRHAADYVFVISIWWAHKDSNLGPAD